MQAYLLYFLSVLAPRLAAFALLIGLTRILNTDDYALFALSITLGEALEGVAGGWLRIILIREGSGKAGEQVWDAIGAGFLLCVVSILLVSLAAVPLVHVLGAKDALWLYILSVGYMATGSLLRFSLAGLQIMGLHGPYGSLEITRGLSIPPAVVLATLAWSPSALTVVGLVILSQAGFGAAGLFLLLRRRRGRLAVPRRAEVVGFVRAGFPFVVGMALGYVLAISDRLVLNAVLGSTAVAFYSASYALGRQPFEVISTALNAYNFPCLVRAFEHAGRIESDAVLRTMFTQMAMFGAAGIAAAIALRSEVAAVLLPAPYQAVGRQVFPVVTAATVLLCFKSFFFDNILLLQRRNWLSVRILAVGAVLAPIMSAGLAYEIGPVGAAWSFFLASLICCVLSWASSRDVSRAAISPSLLVRLLAFGCLVGIGAELGRNAGQHYSDLVALCLGLIAALLSFVAGVLLLLPAGAHRLRPAGQTDPSVPAA